MVGLTNGETLLIGEVKFRQQPVGYDVLAQLENEAPLIDWTPNETEEPEYEYVLFSRSGFKLSVETEADERDDLRLSQLMMLFQHY